MPDGESKIRDKFFYGVIFGITSIGLEYLLLLGLKMILESKFNSVHLLDSLRIAFIILAFNIILFRIIIVNWDKPKTGKGVLMSIIVAAVIYALLHKNYINIR